MGVIEVSQFVRFEMHFTDIDYGVLDVAVTFHSEGQLVHMYLLHYFALTERHDKNSCLYDGWQDMFDFPPALQKLVVTHQGRTIKLFQQQCIAINDKGISVTHKPPVRTDWSPANHLSVGAPRWNQPQAGQSMGP